MTDPYKVLDVSTSATDEEIKEAYRNLAKKYHPDQYAESPLKDLADEKMKEINEAYDTIVSQRKQGTNTGNAGGGYQNNAAGYNSVNGNNASEFKDVRSYINGGRIAEAEQILNGVPQNRKNAEWYFLKGSILYRRGWVEEAKEHFSQACQMDPNNMEYNMAMKQVMSQGRGTYGGYTPNMNQSAGCNSCDVCQGLICADCCCECMGGDLIPCC